MNREMTVEERQKLQEGVNEQFTRDTAEICVFLRRFDEIDWDKMFDDYQKMREKTNDLSLAIDLNYHRIISVLGYHCQTDYEIDISRDIESPREMEDEVRLTIYDEFALAPRFDENFNENDLLKIYQTIDPNSTFAEFIRNATELEVIDEH